MRAGPVLLMIAMMTGQAVAGPWPGGKRAAVVLTYDDTLVSQLDIAIPALDAAGLVVMAHATTPLQRGFVLQRAKPRSTGPRATRWSSSHCAQRVLPKRAGRGSTH